MINVQCNRKIQVASFKQQLILNFATGIYFWNKTWPFAEPFLLHQAASNFAVLHEESQPRIFPLQPFHSEFEIRETAKWKEILFRARKV